MNEIIKIQIDKENSLLIIFDKEIELNKVKELITEFIKTWEYNEDKDFEEDLITFINSIFKTADVIFLPNIPIIDIEKIETSSSKE